MGAGAVFFLVIQLYRLEKVREELSEIGMYVKFKDDGYEHDGYCIIEIIIPE